MLECVSLWLRLNAPPRTHAQTFSPSNAPPWRRTTVSSAIAPSKQKLFTRHQSRWVHKYVEYALEEVLLDHIQNEKRDTWFLNALKMTLFLGRFLHLCFILWISHRLFLCYSSLYIEMSFVVVGLLHIMHGNENALVILARVSTWLMLLLFLF